MIELTAHEISVLRHALGLSASGHGTMYRNHFVTGVGSDDYPACTHLVELGLMVRRPPSVLTGGDDLFHATSMGRTLATSRDPLPKVSRSQARYRRFLDADCGLRFGDWLKTPWADA